MSGLQIDTKLVRMFKDCLLPFLYTGELPKIDFSLEEVFGFFQLLDYYDVQGNYTFLNKHKRKQIFKDEFEVKDEFGVKNEFGVKDEFGV